MKIKIKNETNIMRGELHCHSIYSTGTKIFVEGLNRPKEIIEHAKRLNLDIVALTDHDTMRGVKEGEKYAKKYGIIFVPGEEVSTRQGHVLALGIQEEIKPNMDIEETVDEIHAQGGVAVAAHPFDFRRKGAGRFAIYCDAVEAFNAFDIERASNWRAMRFAAKHEMPVTAGSDAHALEMMGRGITLFPCCGDVDDVLRAIKTGRTKIEGNYIPVSTITEWSVKRLKYSYYYVINYINSNYAPPKKWVCLKLMKLLDKSPGKIDYLFKCLGYFASGVVIAYAVFMNFIIGTIDEILG